MDQLVDPEGDDDPYPPSRPALYVVDGMLPALPPGCRFERDEDGWVVYGAQGQLVSADLDAEEAAEEAWTLYRSFVS